MEWIEDEFLPGVGKRGAAVIEARGSSSAASAASAAIDHMRDWVEEARRLGLDGRGLGWLLRRTRGPHLRLSVHVRGGRWEVVQGLEVDEFSRERIDASVAELVGERDTVAEQGMI